MSEDRPDLARTLPDHADPAQLLRGRDEPDDFGLLTDVLLPVLLFCMLGALVWFLLDVVAARFEAPFKLLRLIVFFFMIAVVGIARLRARAGDLSAGTYGLALVAVMGLFSYLFSYGGGAFGGGYGGRHPLALMLLLDALVVAIWFGAHYLVEQTAIDPDDEALQSAGILSSDEWSSHGQSAGAVRRRANPGRAVMVLSLFALLIFAAGHRMLAGHEFQSHAFWCMVVFLGSAMLVLALAALAGLELYLRGRGARLPWSVTALWLLLSAPLAAAFLGLAHVAPKLEPRDDSFRPKLPAWMAKLALPGGPARFDAPWLGDAPPSDDPQSYAAGGDDRTGQGGLGGGSPEGRATERSSRESGPPSEGTSRGRGEGGAGTMAGPGGADGQGGEGGGRAAGAGEGPGNTEDPAGPPRTSENGQLVDQGGEPRPADLETPSDQTVEQPDAEQPSDELGGNPERSSEPPTRPESASESAPETAAHEESGEQEPAEESGDTRQNAAVAPAEPESQRPEQDEPERRPPSLAVERFAKLFGLLVALGLLSALLYGLGRAALRRAGGWWAARRPPPMNRPLKLRDVFRDPFSPRSPLRDRPPADTVVHVYRAFLAYCELLGKPRRAEWTAHEFLFELPASVESWRPMIVALTELYEAVEYTPELIGDDVRDELRPIWERLMAAVREVSR